MRHTWVVAVIAIAASGIPGCFCSNKLEGSVDVNGETLSFDSCKNGVTFGARGVELIAKNGMRLRVLATPTGESSLVVVPKGATTGVEVGTCGSLQLADQNSTVNDVKNIEGKAVLACEANGYKVSGTVSFSNCH